MVDMEIDKKKMPEKKIRAGPIAVAIWRNKTDDGKRSFYSVSFEKRYMDTRTEVWKSTTSLNKTDIPQAILALQEAFRYLTLHKTPQELIDEALIDEESFWDNKEEPDAESIVVPDEEYSKYINEPDEEECDDEEKEEEE
ncbi:hypothetical protein KY325_00370 [Candidatus Woesearchaeota archaeon]|nr:hypothetical protein [Candidatus Woesearchaeota archaeon]MBW3017599.1 hypothetical protein [Candidatus Woesearchaeota archaeon]